MEGTEFNVQNVARVASDQRELSELALVVHIQHGKSSSTAGVPNESNEFVACCNLVAVPRTARWLDSIIGVLLLGWGSKDMTKFRRTNNSRRHLRFC